MYVNHRRNTNTTHLTDNHNTHHFSSLCIDCPSHTTIQILSSHPPSENEEEVVLSSSEEEGAAAADHLPRRGDKKKRRLQRVCVLPPTNMMYVSTHHPHTQDEDHQPTTSTTTSSQTSPSPSPLVCVTALCGVFPFVANTHRTGIPVGILPATVHYHHPPTRYTYATTLMIGPPPHSLTQEEPPPPPPRSIIRREQDEQASSSSSSSQQVCVCVTGTHTRASLCACCLILVAGNHRRWWCAPGGLLLLLLVHLHPAGGGSRGRDAAPASAPASAPSTGTTPTGRRRGCPTTRWTPPSMAAAESSPVTTPLPHCAALPVPAGDGAVEPSGAGCHDGSPLQPLPAAGHAMPQASSPPSPPRGRTHTIQHVRNKIHASSHTQ